MQPSYGPEPNLIIYAVSATIQLMFSQEWGRANQLLLSTQTLRAREEFVNDQQHLGLSAAYKIRYQNDVRI